MNRNLEDVAAWEASIAAPEALNYRRRYLLPVVEAFSAAERKIRDAREEELQAYIDGLPESGRKAYTAEALRSFFRFAVREGFAERVPKLVGPRPRRHRTPIPSEETVGRFLDGVRALARDESVFPHQRQMLARAAVEAELIYACGLSRSQLVALTDDDVRATPPSLSVGVGPGRRRTVPITRSALEAVGYWKELGGRPAGKASWLLHGRNEPHVRCEPKKVMFDLRAAAKHTGTRQSDAAPRTLRRAFAQHMLDRGFGQEDLAYVLGLADLTSLQLTYLDD